VQKVVFALVNFWNSFCVFNRKTTKHKKHSSDPIYSYLVYYLTLLLHGYLRLCILRFVFANLSFFFATHKLQTTYASTKHLEQSKLFKNIQQTKRYRYIQHTRLNHTYKSYLISRTKLTDAKIATILI